MNHVLFAAADAPPAPSAGQIFASEFLGTCLLIVLGVGVVANHLLKKTKGNAGGWLMINFGWAFAVFTGCYAAYKTGGHLNPAVTVMKVVQYAMDGKAELAAGVPVTATNVLIYFVAQFLGAFVGAVLAWAAYKQHYDEDLDPATKLGTFTTGAEIRNGFWNTITEAIATFVLLSWVMVSGGTETAVGPLGVALIILVIGISLGGPTGYALNPARDFSPRLAHAILPIKGKGGSDWGYAWVPFAGPLLAAVLTPPIIIGLGLLP